MAFLLVDNASLHLAEAAEDISNLTVGSTGTTYKQSAAKDSNMVTG
jgi:hypothetical protein